VIIQNLIIYKLNPLYQILEELHLDLNFKIIFVDSDNSLNDKLKTLSNYLIISNKKYFENKNQLILETIPINISKFIEKINIEFLKFQFNRQSDLMINGYKIDLNSREILKNKIKLKLTEKEINTIIYLSKSNKSVGINELQLKVWDYQSDLETHTVETHIYRLKKKFLNFFNDKNFIVSDKNGYKIIRSKHL
jgi:DNA-binding winged helix-turn-helix (wHTH) protein